MDYNVKSVGKKKIAGVSSGPSGKQTVKQGFEQLMMWVDKMVPARRSGWLFTTTIQTKSRRKAALRHRRHGGGRLSDPGRK